MKTLPPPQELDRLMMECAHATEFPPDERPAIESYAPTSEQEADDAARIRSGYYIPGAGADGGCGLDCVRGGVAQMSVAADLARIASGEVDRVDLSVTDEQWIAMSSSELLAKQEEIKGAIAIGRQLGLFVVDYRDHVRMLDVVALSRQEP